MSGVDRTAVIRVLTETNPKRKRTAAYRRFGRLRDGMSVADYVRLGPWARNELRHNLKRGYIRLDPASPGATTEPAPAPETP